jgi:acyl dehydratase
MSPAPDLAAGSVRTGRPMKLSLARVLAFSGGPFDAAQWPERNLHTDLAKAQEAGLSHIIASGTQSEGLLIGFLLDVFADDWYRSGELDVRFVKPVRVDDTVLPCIRCTQCEHVDGGVQYSLECWCQVDDGSRVVEGTARCTVRGATGSITAS